jgi:hypothetical protein
LKFDHNSRQCFPILINNVFRHNERTKKSRKRSADLTESKQSKLLPKKSLHCRECRIRDAQIVSRQLRMGQAGERELRSERAAPFLWLKKDFSDSAEPKWRTAKTKVAIGLALAME